MHRKLASEIVHPSTASHYIIEHRHYVTTTVFSLGIKMNTSQRRRKKKKKKRIPSSFAEARFLKKYLMLFAPTDGYVHEIPRRVASILTIITTSTAQACQPGIQGGNKSGNCGRINYRWQARLSRLAYLKERSLSLSLVDRVRNLNGESASHYPWPRIVFDCCRK